VWTGAELIAIGPAPDPSDASALRPVAAYSPAADSWRELASVDPAAAHGRPADAPFLRQSDAFWTGDGLLWAGAMMRYDAGTDRWEALPLAPGFDAPVRRHFAWTGTQLLLVQLGADTLGFDPTASAWRRLGGAPPASLGFVDSAATWNGTEMIVIFWRNEAAAFDPAAGSWRELPAPPNEQGICPTRALMHGGAPLFEICGRLYRFADGRWTEVGSVTHDAPKATLFTQLIDSGEAVFLWASDGGPGDPANPDLPFTQFEVWVPTSAPASSAPADGAADGRSTNGQFAVALPPTWREVPGNSYWNAGEPIEQLTVANEDVVAEISTDCELPVKVFDQLSSTGAVVAIRPLTSGASIDPPPSGEAAVPTENAGAYGRCQAVQTDFLLGSFLFRYEGQQFMLHTALGKDAGPEQRQQLIDVVDSLLIRVDPADSTSTSIERP
jgi:hypothetical protein